MLQYYGKGREVEGVDLSKEANSRFAVAVVGTDGETKFDTRYVRLVA